MKALFLLVETSKVDCDIIYANPPHNFDQLFQLKEEDGDDIVTFCKDKVQQFLSSTAYFGMVNTKSLLGYSTNVVKDFLAPTKKSLSHEIIIEDIYLLTQSITYQVKSQGNQITALNLVIQLPRWEAELVALWKRSLVYLAKVFELDEQMRGYLSIQVGQIYERNAEFEKKVAALPGEIDKMKLSKQEIPKRLCDNIKALAAQKIHQLELFQILSTFFESNSGFKINHFGYQLPSADVILNPIQLDIKPYQTIILKKNLCLQIMSNIKSLRFEKFVSIANPTLSFNDMSLHYNFSLKEMQVYVSHLLTHQKCFILNKLTQDSIFTLNPKYEFTYDKPMKKLADHFFNRYRFDLISVIVAFNKPSKCSTIYQEIAGFGRSCLISLIGQKVIQECEVFLYQRDPTFTLEKFRNSGLRKNDQVPTKSASMSQIDLLISSKDSSTSAEEKTDTLIMRYITKYLGQRVSLHEIAWKLGADVSLLWKFLDKYSQLIGYYFIL